MKKIKFTLFLCFALHLGWGQSQQGANLKLENEFIKENLNAENLAAFEFRAKQKVIDFCNYIELISSKEYDKEFREHAKNTATGLFYDKSCRITDSLFNSGTSSLQIQDYFGKVYESSHYKIECLASNLVLAEKLQQISPSHFTGMIKFTQTIKCFNNKGEITYSSLKSKTVGVSLSRIVKTFGSTDKLIWEVSLCDVV